MDTLAKVQTFVSENTQNIGIGLVVVVLLLGIAWFLMSRSQTKSPELENKARINESSTSPGDQGPTQEQLEEAAKLRAQAEPHQEQPSSESE
jgi:uncharacterized protein HemX